MRGWRPPLMRRHTGSHVDRVIEPWPTRLDVAVARRKLSRFVVLNPVAVRQPVSFAQLVLMYEQQHQAAAVLAAALDRELAR